MATALPVASLKVYFFVMIRFLHSAGSVSDQGSSFSKKVSLVVFCKHFLEKVADKNGECCISKTEIVAGTFQTEDFRLLKHAGIHR